MSAKYENIARPYAKAAFDYAHEQKNLAQWKVFLSNAVMIARNAEIVRLLDNPEVATQKALDLFLNLLGEMGTGEKNLLCLLAQYKRLSLLPTIHELFNAYYAALEKMSKVRVITAIDVEDKFKQQLQAALTRRIAHDVTLHCEIDPSILGGAVIQMGDNVIDGSVRGKLHRLLNTLTGV
jgi:F-type H+-transporting ATPase subunit delta